MTNTNLGIDEFDKKLNSCKPVVILHKLLVSDIAKYKETFRVQTGPFNLKKLGTQKSEKNEFFPTMISNDDNELLSKNIDSLKVHHTALLDAKQTKTNDVANPVIEISNISDKFSVMNPDDAVFTSDTSELTTETKIYPEHSAEALIASKHSDETLTVFEHSDETLTVFEHSEEALTVPGHSDETPTVYEHNNEALTIPEHSDEASTVPEHSNGAATVPEHSDEAPTVLEHKDEAPTVPEPSVEAPTVPDHSEVAPPVPQPCEEVPTVPEQSDEALTVPEYSDETSTVPEYSDEASTVPEYSYEASTVPEYSDEASTVPEYSDEAPTVPEHCDGASAVLEPSKEAITVPELSAEASTVPEPSDDALTVLEHSDEASTVLEPCEEAVTVFEPREEAPTVPEHSNEAPTVLEPCEKFPTVLGPSEEAPTILEPSDDEHNDEALTVPKYCDEALIIPTSSDEALTAPEHCDGSLIIPEHYEALTVPEHCDKSFPVPKQSDEVLRVSEHSDGELTVPEHSGDALTISKHRDEALTVPEHSDEVLTVPEHGDVFAVPDHSDEAIRVPENTDEALTVSEHNDDALLIPEPRNDDLTVPEYDDKANSVSGLIDEAQPAFKDSNVAQPVSGHSDEAQPVSEHRDEAQPASGHSNKAQPVIPVKNLIDNCLNMGVMTSDGTEKSVTGSGQTVRTSEAVEQNIEMLMPNMMKKTLVGAKRDEVAPIIEQQAEGIVFSEQTKLPFLSNEQGKEVLLTSEQTCVTPIVCEFNNQTMILSSEQTDMAEVVPGVTAEPNSDSYFTDQTEDSMTDMDLVYQKLRIGQTGEALSETSKTGDVSSLLPVSNIQAEASLSVENSFGKYASNKCTEIGSKEFCRKSSVLHASGPLIMSVDTNDDCSLKNDLSSKVQEALAIIEYSGNIDELKRTIFENSHVQDTSQSQTTLCDGQDAFTATPEEQLSALGTVEKIMTMIDDSVVFDDGPTTKQQTAITDSQSTEAQESRPGQNVYEKDKVMNTPNEEEVPLDCVQNLDDVPIKECKGKTCIVDYDEEETDEGCMDKSGEGFQELVKYDISDDDYCQGSDSDSGEEQKVSENLDVTQTVQTQDVDDNVAYDYTNSSDNCHADEVDSSISESTDETSKSNFTNKDLQDDDSQPIKSEHVQGLEGMSGESPESGSQGGISNPAKHKLNSSSPVAVEPAPNKNNGKNQLHDPNAFEEGAPHFYLVGDDLISTVAANIPTAWSNNVTVLTGEKLTLSDVPALLKERVSSQHLNQRQPVYFVCFVGLYNFIQLEARDCMMTDSPKCRCQIVTLPVTSRIDAETQLRSRVANIKQELAKLIAGEHYLIIPDIQLIDLSRYQKYLDRVHKEVFDHELKHSESAKRLNQKIAIDLVGIIVYLNEIIGDSYAFVDKKLPWLLLLWQMEKPFTRNKLRQIPVTNGYLLTDSATKVVTDCMTELLDEYTKQDLPTSLERVYFIGDPRLSTLTPHWPKNGVEIVIINDGNLAPSMVAQKIKNDCQNLERCLIVICFSIKSHVTIKSVSSCEGHDPCKYVVYQVTNESVVEKKTLDMVETICNDLKNSSLTFEIAFSPLIPVNYFKYRSIIETRHLKNTGHSIAGQLPDQDVSNKETCQMARDIHISRSFLTTEMKRRDFSVLDIPSCILEPDVISSTAQLVNGMSLTSDMAKRIVGITLTLINLLNDMREERKMTSKRAKYKLLRDSVGNALNQAGAERTLAGGHPGQSRVEDLSNKLHGGSNSLELPDSVNHKTEPSNRQQVSQKLDRPCDKERYDSSFSNQSSMSTKILPRLGNISQYSTDSRMINYSTTHRPLSPKRGKSRSPRRNDSRLSRRDRPHGSDRTASPKRERSRSPRRSRHWSPTRVRSRSPRRDRSFSPRETRERYAKRGRSKSKSVDRRSRNKRSSSRFSRHDRNRHPKKKRSKSRSRSHSRRRRSKSFSASSKNGPKVVSKKEFSKMYDKHLQSFQPFLAKPETHPDYENWLKTQILTERLLPIHAMHVRLNWERRINELMNISWKNIKSRYSVKTKNKRHSRSDSSSSASSSSLGGGAKKKKSTKHKKKNRSESNVALNIEDARKSASASTSSISALVDRYVSQLPSPPKTKKYAKASSNEIPQPNSDSINWPLKSFVELSQEHGCEPSTRLADTSYIPRSSEIEIVPNYSARSVHQPPPSYPITRDYADYASATQLSRSLPSEPEVSSTSDRTSPKSLKVIEILKLLVQVKGKAGVVGETLPLVLNRVQSARDRGVRELSCFNSDDIILLGLIKSRLCRTSQEPHVSFIEKVIIDEAVSQLETLMEMVQDALDNAITFFDIDVLSRVTEKYSISESMTYIKNLLGEFKRPNSEDDVLPVFVELVKFRGAL